MFDNVKEPQQKLSKDAVKVWMITDTIHNLIAFIILGIFLYFADYFSWKEWIVWIIWGIIALSVLGLIWSYISPFLLYKSWRYDVNEEYLLINSGVLLENRKIVPMTKIQSVATNQGPILRRYGLCKVSVETMASSHEIPALPKEVAEDLRNQIAHFAKIREVES